MPKTKNMGIKMNKGIRDKSFKIEKGVEITSEPNYSKGMYFSSNLKSENLEIVGELLDESVTSKEFRKRLDILIAAAKEMISQEKH